MLNTVLKQTKKSKWSKQRENIVFKSSRKLFINLVLFDFENEINSNPPPTCDSRQTIRKLKKKIQIRNLISVLVRGYNWSISFN